MAKSIEFEGPMVFLPEAPNSGAVEFPFDMTEVFGKKSVKVKITYDGVPYRGLLKSMGGGKVYCLIRKEIRQQIGKNPGDLVKVTVEEDMEERIVEVPVELEDALKSNRQAGEIFEKLSYTCKKEYARWIAEAKREETKKNRLSKAVEMLLAGKKSPV